MDEAVDGDTIGLRGEFVGYIFGTIANKAVRLLGMPAATPYRWVHAAAPGDAPGPRMAQLRRCELDSAAELGFPSASIHVTNNGFEAIDAAWLENIFISSGPRAMGSPLPGEHEFADVSIRFSAAQEPKPAFCAICCFKSNTSVDAISSSAVLRRCWLTGCFGTSIVVEKHSSAALLKCVITNSRYHEVYAAPDAMLRMRGCCVMCSGQLRQQGAPGFALSESQHALFTSENDIFRFARPALLPAHESEVPERVTTYRPFFDPRRACLLT